MPNISYKRASNKTDFANHIRLSDEIVTEIRAEHGSIKTWLKTILGEPVTVEIDPEQIKS